MTLFQAILHGWIHGWAEFIPVSPSAHHTLLSYLLGWPEPNPAFIGCLSAGSFLALLVYFRHDWASMISSLLQVILYRKRPRTIDEKMPLFVIVSCLPPTLAWYYLHDAALQFEWSPLSTAISLAVFAIPLGFADSVGRKNKNMYDWNWLDALILGIAEIASMVPGFGRMTGALPAALMRNYSRQAAAKFAFFAATPLLAGSAYLHLRNVELHSPVPIQDVTWLSLVAAIVITFLTGLLTIGGLMNALNRKGLNRYMFYRWFLASMIGVAYWWRARSG
jgi:undecaprenyl-diphosphatase